MLVDKVKYDNPNRLRVCNWILDIVDLENRNCYVGMLMLINDMYE